MSDRPHQSKIVGDEEIGDLLLALKVEQQLDDLRAHRDVERRDRFVQHDQRRLRGDGAHDRHALPLAAGDFMDRPAGEARFQPDAFEQLGDAARPFRAWRDGVDAQRIIQNPRHGSARVEGGERILKHHLQLRSCCPQRRSAQGQPVVAFEGDRAGVRLDQPQHQPRDGRFAAAGRTGKRQRFARLHPERDVLDGGDGFAAAGEAFRQALDGQERAVHRAVPAVLATSGAASRPICASSSARV